MTLNQIPDAEKLSGFFVSQTQQQKTTNSENPNEDAPMKIEGAKNSRAKIIDCTIRDGGLMNSSRFSDKTVRTVYDCCADSGAEYMEIGFKNSKKIFSPAEYGAWRFCDEGDIARIIGSHPRNVKLSVMADDGKSDYKTDILDKSRSPIDLVHVACYNGQLDEVLDMAKDTKDKGYEVSINLMAAYKLSEHQMMSDIEKRLAESDADILYLMDSFGYFYRKHVATLMKAIYGICRPRGKKIGFHTHNDLQIAFAKTVQAERRLPGLHTRGARARRGQLQYGTAARIPRAGDRADNAMRTEGNRANAPKARVGIRAILHVRGISQPTPAHGDGITRKDARRRHTQILRDLKSGERL